MSEFTFTDTVECEACGNTLSDSGETCDHDGKDVEIQIFRHLYGGRESLVGVRATRRRAFDRLESAIGDDWIRYHYLGPKESVNRMLRTMFDDVNDIPAIAMATDRVK